MPARTRRYGHMLCLDQVSRLWAGRRLPYQSRLRRIHVPGTGTELSCLRLQGAHGGTVSLYCCVLSHAPQSRLDAVRTNGSKTCFSEVICVLFSAMVRVLAMLLQSAFVCGSLLSGVVLVCYASDPLRIILSGSGVCNSTIKLILDAGV
jgi:hypothetical protein